MEESSNQEIGEKGESNLDEVIIEVADDLEDLRSALIDALTHYERRLKAAIGEIPVWTEVTASEVHTLFEIPEIEDALLGPRAVAIVAQFLNEHVEIWLGSYEIKSAKVFEEVDTEQYRKSCAKVEGEFIALLKAARKRASLATEELGKNLDTIMARLEKEREGDENALKDLVVDGSVEKGDSAREEIADVWERYRSHAEILTLAWETLEALVFEGLDMIVAGVEDMRWIMRQSEGGLTLLNPHLDPDYEVFVIPDREGPRSTFELDRGEPEVETEESEAIEERETIELERHLSETSEDLSTSSEFELHKSSELSEISEGEEDEAFWATRKTTKAESIPLFELMWVWGIPLTLSAGIVIAHFLHLSDPNLPDPKEVIPQLPGILAFLVLWFLLLPFLRKWTFSKTSSKVKKPYRNISTDEDLKINVSEFITLGDQKIEEKDLVLYRWEDLEHSKMGWVLVGESISVSTEESNVTRWESSSADIGTTQSDTWILPRSKFRKVCRGLGIKL